MSTDESRLPPLDSILPAVRAACAAHVAVAAVSVPLPEVAAARAFAAKQGDLFKPEDVIADDATLQDRFSGLHWRGFTTVVPDPTTPAHRLILLPLAAPAPAGAPAPVPYTLHLTYDHLSPTDVLSLVLPPTVTPPAAFECAGHLAHLNLRDSQLDHKYVIGAVILDKHPALKTVVNKTGAIEGEFRVLPMELIAGRWLPEVTVREGGSEFSMDYSKVYWNSRLSAEHARVVARAVAAGRVAGDEESVRRYIAECSTAAPVKTGAVRPRPSSAKPAKAAPTTLICDLFAGIGPFAVPAAKAGGLVIANDLNPASVRWLTENVRRNGVTASVGAVCADARALVAELAEQKVCVDCFIMNLPPLGPEFCDAFRGRCGHYETMPRVFCHGFAPCTDENEGREHIEGRVAAALGCSTEELAKSLVETHVVRLVAPRKLMLCVEFNVPESVGRAN